MKHLFNEHMCFCSVLIETVVCSNGNLLGNYGCGFADFTVSDVGMGYPPLTVRADNQFDDHSSLNKKRRPKAAYYAGRNCYRSFVKEEQR